MSHRSLFTAKSAILSLSDSHHRLTNIHNNFSPLLLPGDEFLVSPFNLYTLSFPSLYSTFVVKVSRYKHQQNHQTEMKTWSLQGVWSFNSSLACWMIFLLISYILFELFKIFECNCEDRSSLDNFGQHRNLLWFHFWHEKKLILNRYSTRNIYSKSRAFQFSTNRRVERKKSWTFPSRLLNEPIISSLPNFFFESWRFVEQSAIKSIKSMTVKNR